ncbi:cobalt-zinc-cadmium resistance protein [Variovorax robiniae]|uniref:Cobalt-zinc-cadmium resistance protein n=1 Tax=Variovorax robiniae TaxID=1836199 RepID=A0ABU8X7U8_9BURK
MRKLVFLLLLAILPLQFSWGAAAAYCRHEAGAGAPHFGHHEHQAKASSTDHVKDGKLKTIADGDDDCGMCHASAAEPAPSRQATLLVPWDGTAPAYRAPSYQSFIPHGLERPARPLAS